VNKDVHKISVCSTQFRPILSYTDRNMTFLFCTIYEFLQFTLNSCKLYVSQFRCLAHILNNHLTHDDYIYREIKNCLCVSMS